MPPGAVLRPVARTFSSCAPPLRRACAWLPRYTGLAVCAAVRSPQCGVVPPLSQSNGSHARHVPVPSPPGVLPRSPGTQRGADHGAFVSTAAPGSGILTGALPFFWHSLSLGWLAGVCRGPLVFALSGYFPPRPPLVHCRAHQAAVGPWSQGCWTLWLPLRSTTGACNWPSRTAGARPIPAAAASPVWPPRLLLVPSRLLAAHAVLLGIQVAPPPAALRPLHGASHIC